MKRGVAPLVLPEVGLDTVAHDFHSEHVEELLDECWALAISNAIVEALCLVSRGHSATNRVSRSHTVFRQAPKFVL